MKLHGSLYCKVCEGKISTNFYFCTNCIRKSGGGFIQIKEKCLNNRKLSEMHYVPFNEISSTRTVLFEKFENVENQIKTLFVRAALQILINKGFNKDELFSME